MTELRLADAADAPALHRIASAAYSPYLPRMGGQRPGPLDADYAAAVEECETWLALLDGSPVGFVVLAGDGSDMLVLENVAVLPSHRGRGIGRTLLELAEARATTRGCTRIRLFTHVTMVENQALYARIGYVRTHQATDDGVTLVFYEKVL